MQTLFWGGTLTKEQEEFQKWCWKLAMMLKLHPAQISVETYRQVEDWASPSHMGLTWANLFQEEELVDVARAVRAAGLLATYVGLCVSSIGTKYVVLSVWLCTDWCSQRFTTSSFPLLSFCCHSLLSTLPLPSPLFPPLPSLPPALTPFCVKVYQ